MTTEAELGIGTQLQYETVVGASPLAFTDVPEVLDIPTLTETREFVEATNQDSGDTREYIAGLNDAEEVTIEMNYLPHSAAQNELYTRYQARTRCKWRVVEESTSPDITWEFDAFIASHGVSFPTADKKVRTIVLRRTGPMTRT